jgi:hypothetical protein
MDDEMLIPMSEVPGRISCSLNRAYELVREGKLPAQKISGRLYVRAQDLALIKIRPSPWLKSRPVKQIIIYRQVEAPMPGVDPKPEVVEQKKELVEA